MKKDQHRGRSIAAGLLSAGSAMASILCATAPALAGPAAPSKAGAIDYLTAPYRAERILDWGDRPNWSPDGRRIVFTKDDLHDGPAYEIDVRTRKVRCITCQFGKTQFVTRIFYLPDNSFLIEAAPGMAGGSGGAADAGRTELFWMSKSLARPVPLGTGAMGDIAIARKSNADGSVNISWSRPKDKGLQLAMGRLTHDGRTARIEDVQGLYNYQPGQPGDTSFPEAYEFIDGGRAVMFWTIEPATTDNEMYKVDIATKVVSKVYATPAHNETHLFPDERYGLEESNFLSDPDGPYRGVSALGKSGVEMILRMKGIPNASELAAANSDKGFDIYVVSMDGKSRRPLTRISQSGAQAHQSIVSPDGRQIAYAIKDDKGGSGHDAGLYIGTFGK